ncbi:type I-E CRISPR-associated protein Cas5/CasD [Actinacidiphila soli]|uniref:type I-E CRISPR-associated protein Cas5/CasD n=1 Tax=Actinacidiphila soli TaxID=2487275 RepID=UPI000FCBF989|nr:type I-E CRISPR-associated protein Cas5/CasD [Actinacidiphila soli]
MTPADDPGHAPAGILLHLAGPLQSWGTHSAFNERDTARFPTRSGIIGLLAACLGRRRGEAVDDLARLSLTSRTDRGGVLLRDLHTVGGGLPAKGTVTTAEGKKRPQAQATLLSHRSYLADAAFTAALTGNDTALLRECADALRHPVWPPYLGRRSCPPEGPLLIGLLEDPLHHLVRLPLACASTPLRQPTSNPPAEQFRGKSVDFHSDAPLHRLPIPSAGPNPDHLDGSAPVGEVTDDPLDLSPRRRTYRARPVYRRSVHLPDTPRGGLGANYLTALHTYLNSTASEKQGGAA